MSDYLFRVGSFTLHSGKESTWKIDCDALLDEELEAIANIARDNLPHFGAVHGIPTGGLRLARAFEPYRVGGSNITLIVDDVLTTGRSMVEAKQDFRFPVGFVIFARGECPDWITPMFRCSLS